MIKKLYGKYAVQVTKKAQIKGFDINKEEKDLKRDLIPVLVIFGVAFFIAYIDNIILSSDFWLQVLFAIILSILFCLIFVLITVITLNGFVSIIFFMSYFMASIIIFRYINSIYPVTNQISIYILFLCFCTFIFLLLTMYNIKIIKAQIKKGVVFPDKR
jgi:hypothetical protein